MNAQEKRRMLALLEEGKRALLESLRGVTPQAALRAPSPEKWSILDCVEHVAVAEDYLLSQIRSATFSENPSILPQRETLLAERALNRSLRFESPEALRPAGRFPSVAEALEHFLATREHTVEFVRGDRGDARRRVTSHPLIGPANCREMLLLMAMHPKRHAEQIVDIKTALESAESKKQKVRHVSTAFGRREQSCE
jgi:hypothetical protein